MKISIRSWMVLLGLAVFAATCSLGCSSNGDMSSNDTVPKATSASTGQHSPPPMTRKAGMMQPGGGSATSSKAIDN